MAPTPARRSCNGLSARPGAFRENKSRNIYEKWFLDIFSGLRPRLQGLGSAIVPVAVGRVSRPTSSPIPSCGFFLGLAALKEKAGRNVFGGTPNTACGTHALPKNRLSRSYLRKTLREPQKL